MKKIITLILAVVTIQASAQAPFIEVKRDGFYNPARNFSSQGIENASVVSDSDTLHYFFNKHYYRNSTATVAPTGFPGNTLFYTVSTPYTTSTISITHCGSIFMNSSSIQVHGLEGMATRRANSTNTAVPIRLYLCNLSGANLPIFPPLDSVNAIATTAANGTWLGGNFSAPITVTGNFAVLIKNVSSTAGDTIGPFINNAATATSTVPVRQRYGESFGVMRYNGVFYSNTGIFGAGTDYEFVVAPRVSFNYTAGVMPLTPTVCTNGAGSFSNTTAPQSIIENRQFNFNKFALYWRSSVTSPLTNSLIPVTDSIYQWTFTGSSSLGSYAKHPVATFTLLGNQTAQVDAKYMQSANGGGYVSLSDIATGTINVNNSAAPVISISGNTAICSGSSTTLTASGNTTFTWTSPFSTSPSITVSPVVNTTYTVSAENGGCLSTLTVGIIVSTPANVTVTGPSQACVGKTYTLTATGASTYSWSTASTSPAITATAVTPGTIEYTVTGINSGCPPSVVVKQLTINPLPVVSVTPSKTFVCVNNATSSQTITLTGNPTGGVFSGPSFVTGSFNPNSLGTFIATYSYTDMTTTCSKSSTTSIVVDACSGLDKGLTAGEIRVYPNPAIHGIVNISNLEGLNKIEIINILGEIIRTGTTDKNTENLDLSTMPVGSYFIRISQQGGPIKTVKIVNQ
jgi:hypothetical protein